VNERLQVLFGQDYGCGLTAGWAKGQKTGIEIPEVQVARGIGRELTAAR